MNKTAEIYCKGVLAGELEKRPEGYIFTYNKDYFNDSAMPPISLTIPKNEQIHKSEILFPFFFGLLSEGTNKNIQCRVLKIDENDYFRLLLKTAHTDTIGCVTVREKID